MPVGVLKIIDTEIFGKSAENHSWWSPVLVESHAKDFTNFTKKWSVSRNIMGLFSSSLVLSHPNSNFEWIPKRKLDKD